MTRQMYCIKILMMPKLESHLQGSTDNTHRTESSMQHLLCLSNYQQLHLQNQRLKTYLGSNCPPMTRLLEARGQEKRQGDRRNRDRVSKEQYILQGLDPSTVDPMSVYRAEKCLEQSPDWARTPARDKMVPYREREVY